MKQVICNVAHPGSMESLQTMLGSIGYECLTLGADLRDQLKTAGCDTVVSLEGIASGWGWELQHKYRQANALDMARRDVLYIDIKAHRNYSKVVERWPHLKDKVLWYFINGGKPGRSNGDEITPPCPMITPDQWYHKNRPLEAWSATPRYVMWPPFADSNRIQPRATIPTGFPICLVHNISGWGYSDFLPLRHSIQLECAGGYGSPDGMVPHHEVFNKLANALCMVHLKSVDAPGYSLYEAMMTGCPVVIPERFIHRCQAYDLLIPDETCLTFDRYDEPEPLHPEEGMIEVIECVDRLRDLELNRRIGEAGKKRLTEIMWDAGRPADVASLKTFFARHFS